MAEVSTDIRQTVRERYAKAARASAARRLRPGGRPRIRGQLLPPQRPLWLGHRLWGSRLDDDASRDNVPDAAVNASHGCGVPTAVGHVG
jgi:hypothetical protein